MPLLLFTSPKGGVGKTTLSAHTAALLAKRGHRVLALDLDPRNALRLHLGVSIREESGFLKVIDGRSDWRASAIDTPAGVHLLPFGAAEPRRVLQLGAALLDNPELLAAPVRDMLAELGLVVVIDSAPGSSAMVSAVAPLADRTAVILNQVELDGRLSAAALVQASRPIPRALYVAPRWLAPPSYYVFPALQELAAHMRDPLWAAVQSEGLAMMRDGRFGRWMLPPDWLQVSRAGGALEPANGWPPRFSYGAIRVPLYLSWAGQTSTGADEAFRAYWAQQLPDPPAWVDLATGAVAPHAAPPGMRAVGELSLAPAAPDVPPGFPSAATAPDYYSAALTLLARIAWQESRRSKP